MVERHETLAEAMAVLAKFDTPAEPGAATKQICTREEIVTATAIPLFKAFRQDREPTCRELTADCGLAGRYPTEVGPLRTVSDTLGNGRHGCQCHIRHAGRDRLVIRCVENVELVWKRVPDADKEQVALAAGFTSQLELVNLGLSLPSIRND